MLSAYILVMYEWLPRLLHTFIPSPWCKSDTKLVASVVCGNPLGHCLAFGSLIHRVFHNKWATRIISST